jgi:hypothetical protein
VAVACDAAPAPAAPPLAPADTPAWPPVADWAPVTAHGLVGDGVTDNTAALRALLAAPPSRALYVPLGVYALSGTVTVPAQAAPLSLFGLSCWDAVFTLADGAAGFADPAALKPVLVVAPGGAPVWLSGFNLRTGTRYGAPQPPPVPPGFANPNPGSLALLWLSAGGGAQDVFFHPASWPDNARLGTGANTELSLVVADGGGGVFADIWSCNSYAMGGARVRDTAARVEFTQLSSEHHAGHELWVSNASSVAVHAMQTEDRSPDAAPTCSLLAEAASAVDLTGLFSYYAANVSSAAAVRVSSDSVVQVGVYRQFHSYHPLFFNCSILADNARTGGQVCVAATDFALAVVALAPPAAAP